MTPREMTDQQLAEEIRRLYLQLGDIEAEIGEYVQEMKRRKPPRPKSAPTLVRSDDLCKSLVAMAAFSLSDNPEAQGLVYKAVRQLQLLDAEAVKAGILPDALGQTGQEKS